MESSLGKPIYIGLWLIVNAALVSSTCVSRAFWNSMQFFRLFSVYKKKHHSLCYMETSTWKRKRKEAQKRDFLKY